MNHIKVTVCQLADDMHRLEADWAALVEHVHSHGSRLVLLPEMPFGRWFAWEPQFDPAVWQAAMEAHERWLLRLAELSPALVLGSRPVERGGLRQNEGFAWDAQNGYRAAHTKYYLPDEDRFWEASWYQRGNGDFTPLNVATFERSNVATLKAGFLICTELWFMQRARAYGKQDIHILANPRATERSTCDKWLAGGRAAAVVSGAYCLSSNRAAAGDRPEEMGGLGWVISPDGEVLGVTSQERSFVTAEIDLAAAERAKFTYPRYVLD
jgi:N-carbamoylputrescine amidase